MYGFLTWEQLQAATKRKEAKKMWTIGVGPHKTIINLDRLVKVWIGYVSGQHKYFVYGNSEEHEMVLKVCDSQSDAEAYVTNLYKELT